MTIRTKFTLGILALLLIFTSVSCKNGENELYKKKAELFDIGFRQYKVENITKNYASADTELENEECKNWTFKASDLLNLLGTMSEVEPTEAYQKCYQYPCWYEGELFSAESTLEITIYPNSTITIASDSKTEYFILEKKIPLFISACDCCEEE